jgi:glycosyltransferase involved in cell wall biosynthesis
LSKVEVIPNGFDFFTSPTGLGQKKNRIILVTRMFERKGIQFFLRAIAGFKTDWEIIIAGDGPYLPFLKKEAVRCSANVKFVGYLQGRDLIELYQSAKIFVFPSVQENFPVVLLEAMNSGCSVITTKAPGCVEVVGDAAIQVEPRNVEQLRKSLMELMHDEQAMRALSALSLKRAVEFSWPRIARKFDTLFKVLAAKNTPKHEGYMICSEQPTKHST